MAIKQPAQIRRELMGLSSLNFADHTDSSPRKAMYATHLGQALVIDKSTERRIQTGMEREFGKYTFSVKAPCNMEIIRLIERYRPTLGVDSITENPHTVVLYENVDTKEIGMLELTRYCSYHQHFGFKYKPTKHATELRRGAAIPEGTILLDSPSVTENGGYKYGREMNVAFMTIPGVAEDGIVISEDVLPLFKIRTYETRIVEFGSEYFPLNLYGTVENFKAFPDIGEVVREDGLLMALRKDNPMLAPVKQNIYDLMEVDHIFDKSIYAAGPGGRIIDIRVHHDNSAYNAPTPIGMELQATKYDNARRQFYSELLAEYNRLKRERGDALRLQPRLHRLIVEALSVVGESESRIIKMSGKNPLDDWRLEFVIEYEITPTIGFKLTDCHGGKGVICKICKPEEMPIDANGNRADIVMDPNATISRMNLGRLYEQYFNGASRDVVKRISQVLHPDQVMSAPQEVIDQQFEYLVQYYSCYSTRMEGWFRNNAIDKRQHLKRVLKDGIYLYMPPDNEKEIRGIVKELEEKFPQTYGPVTYIGNSGKQITTKHPVRIGSLYIMLLEKTGDDWTAVSSGMLQHFGVLAPIPKSMRHAKPSRTQAIRAIGETEARIYASYVGPEITVDILDRNNSVTSHEAVVDSILRAPYPTNIPNAIDRKTVPLGNSRPLQIVKHIGQCAGWEFVYRKSPQG